MHQELSMTVHCCADDDVLIDVVLPPRGRSWSVLTRPLLLRILQQRHFTANTWSALNTCSVAITFNLIEMVRCSVYKDEE